MMIFSNGPMSSSQRGATQPPCSKPPVGSSSGPPGACMILSSDTNTAPVSLRIDLRLLGEAGELVGDRAPASLEAHLAVLFHILGGPVARGRAIERAVAVGLDFEDADHERRPRLPALRESVGECEALPGHQFEQHAADAFLALA